MAEGQTCGGRSERGDRTMRGRWVGVSCVGRRWRCLPRLMERRRGIWRLSFWRWAGVYVGGGIAPKILKTLKGGGFTEAFLDKGRLLATAEVHPGAGDPG